ncbi:head-tail joining protein [Escherichia coli]
MSSPVCGYRGVFDDPENISYANSWRCALKAPAHPLVRLMRCGSCRWPIGDTLTIGEENFWVRSGFARMMWEDCHLWLGRGVPPAVNHSQPLKGGCHGHKRS